MDIITKIESDHQSIRQGLAAVSAVRDQPSERGTVFTELANLVIRHHDAEMRTLLSALTEHDKSRDKALHLVEEHGEHKKVLEQMDDLRSSSDAWDSRFEELSHDLLHHIAEEEQDLFPLIESVLDHDARIAIGRAMVLLVAEG